MRWGLVPAWFKENDPSKMQYSTNNCRRESLLEKKSYKVIVHPCNSMMKPEGWEGYILGLQKMPLIC